MSFEMREKRSAGIFAKPTSAGKFGELDSGS